MTDKKRNYFVIISVIGILLTLYLFLNVDEIVKNSMDTYNTLSENANSEIMNEFVERLNNNGKNTIYFELFATFAMNTIVLIISLKNKIPENKKVLICLDIALFLFSFILIQQIIAIINFIILLKIKIDKEKSIPISKQIPKLQEIKDGKYELIISILLCIVYFSQFFIEYFDFNNLTLIIVYTIGYYVSTFILALLLWKNYIKRDIVAFKNNWKIYIKYIFIQIVMMYLIYFGVSVISLIATGKVTSSNQETLESIKSYIIIPLAIIYAPIVEETIFRGIIKKIVKNKYIYIIVSAMLFGLMHTIGQEENLLNIVFNALPYSVLGGSLAIIYEKTDNISTNIFAHASFNLVASLLTLI